MTTSFIVPTRAENKKTELSLSVSEGTLTQAKSDALNAGEASIHRIRKKVKSGDLSKEDARNQISAIRETSPAKVTQSDLATQSDVAPEITGLASDLTGKGYSGFTFNTGLLVLKLWSLKKVGNK